MDATALTEAYNASRNGTGVFYRHPLARRFAYSEGVQEMAEAGCYWLVDLLATELPEQFTKRPQHYDCMVTVTVKDSEARIRGEFVDGDKSAWRRKVDYTDLPDGDYKFYVAKEGTEFRCILLSEY